MLKTSDHLIAFSSMGTAGTVSTLGHSPEAGIFAGLAVTAILCVFREFARKIAESQHSNKNRPKPFLERKIKGLDQ